MTNITYEVLYKTIEKYGYTITTIQKNFPNFKNRELINLKPEEAKSLLDYNSHLTKNKIYQTQNDHIENNIKNGTWTPEMGEIKLRESFKIWKGVRILKAIAESTTPIDVYIEVLNSENISFNDTHTDEICNIIKNAIKTIFEKYNLSFPNLTDEIWKKELIANLKNLDIMLYTDNDKEPLDPPTIIGILNNDRSLEYPDKLCIINGLSNSGEIQFYNCNLFPSIDEERPLIIKPGEYKNIFSISPNISGLIQCNEIPIYYPILKNDKIEGYETSPFTFMRVSIPVQESKDGTLPVGAVFENKEIENEFIKNLNTDNITDPITYILFDNEEFEDN